MQKNIELNYDNVEKLNDYYNRISDIYLSYKLFRYLFENYADEYPRELKSLLEVLNEYFYNMKNDYYELGLKCGFCE